mgnify:CR=1 FL=1
MFLIEMKIKQIVMMDMKIDKKKLNLTKIFIYSKIAIK